jgi:hypothetical protein
MQILGCYIELCPSQINLGNISMIIKFIKEFHEQGCILILYIDDPKATLILRSTHWFPSSQTCTSSTYISFAPKEMLPESVYLMYNCR